MRQVDQKSEAQLDEISHKAKSACVDLWKKDALIARITSENEFLVVENQRLKGVNTINDSILNLPSACFIDIQSAQKQREAVHSATAAVIEELAEVKAKESEDGHLRNILEIEEKTKKQYLDMYSGIGGEIDDWIMNYQK